MLQLKHRLEKLNMVLRPQHLYYGPHWLVLGVNNICNLHCKMCDVGTKTTDTNFYQNLMGSNPRDMPRELLWRIIDQAAAFFPRTKLGYAFTEPLIYPHLIESIAHATAKHLYTSITTNGLTLDRLAPELTGAGLSELNVSLDGPPEIHNHIRGHRRSFERAVAGIESFLKSGGRVSVYCTITEWNVGHLRAFLKCLEGLALDEVGFMFPNFTTRSMVIGHNKRFGQTYPATVSNLEEMRPEDTELERLHEEIVDIRSSAYPWRVHFSPELNSLRELENFYHNPEQPIGRRCRDAFTNIMIKSDGSVIPAHGRCYRVTAGNLHKNNLMEIWNAPKLAAFRQTLNRSGGLLPACSRCCSAFTN